MLELDFLLSFNMNAVDGLHGQHLGLPLMLSNLGARASRSIEQRLIFRALGAAALQALAVGAVLLAVHACPPSPLRSSSSRSGP